MSKPSKPKKNNEKPKTNKQDGPKKQDKRPSSSNKNEKPQNSAPSKRLDSKPATNYQQLGPPKDDGLMTHVVRGKYSRRKIDVITRLELPEDIYDTIEESSRGANLHELFNKPVSIGDHFHFKSEKVWEDESKHPDQNDLFTLDIQKIGEHISCIPFYKIVGLDPKIFSEKQIKEMDQEAEFNERKHLMKQSFQPSEDTPELCRTTQDLLKTLILEESQDQKKSNAKENQSDDFELDDLLETCDISSSFPVKKEGNQSSPTIASPSESKKETTEDLEEWLDEYLDS